MTEEEVGVMFPISSERINKLRRRQSIVKGMDDLRKSIRFVMEHYMYHGAEFAINVSSFTRMTVLNSYDQLGLRDSNGDSATASLKPSLDVYSDSETGRSSNASQPNTNESIMYIKIFDQSLEEIIGLLKLDSLSRFYRSKEYKIMTQKD